MDKTMIKETTMTLTALEFSNTHEHVVIRWASTGQPAGVDAFLGHPAADAWDDFDLSNITGHVREDGSFEADDVGDETDSRGNTVTGVWLYADEAKWTRLVSDWESAL